MNKGKIDPRKLAKTRCAVMGIQLRHFSRLHQWHFLLFAIAIFFAKLGRDLLKRVTKVTFYNGNDNLDDASVVHYNNVLRELDTIK